MRRGGYTLIELLVVVGITALLFGAGMAAYRGIGEKQALKEAGASFQSNLRLFQQKALVSEKPTICSSKKFKGFTVHYESASSYSVYAECEPAAVTTVTSITLKDGVEFDGGFNNVFFQVLKAEVLNGGVEGSQTITLKKGTLKYQVSIDQRGGISGGFLP